MKQIIERIGDLPYGAIMEIYEQSNRAAALESAPDRDENVALIQAEQALYAYLDEVFFAREGAFVALWAAEGGYRCALRMEPYGDGYLLNGLETAPQHRGKGYAKALVQAVVDQMAVPVYSHVDRFNAASLRVHEACGFQVVQQEAVYLDGEVHPESLTLCRKTLSGENGY